MKMAPTTFRFFILSLFLSQGNCQNLTAAVTTDVPAAELTATDIPQSNATSVPDSEYNVTDIPNGDMTATDVPNAELAVDGSECYVCGEGREIDPSPQLVTTELGVFTCHGIATAGLQGSIPSEKCATIQGIVEESCTCVGPTHAPTEAPFVCSVCSDGKVATILDQPVSIPDEPANKTCSQYMVEAETFDNDQCNLLQEYTNAACGCEEPTHESLDYKCQICGDGFVPGNPDASLQLVSGEIQSCGFLETLGSNGQIPEFTCHGIQAYSMHICECKPEGTLEPTSAPTNYQCPICGPGMEVTIPDGEVNVPGISNTTCSALMESAEAGNISPGECGLLHGWVKHPCGCLASDEISAVPSDFPSLAPTGVQPTTSPAPTGYLLQKDGCFSSLAEIHDLEMNLPNADIRRKYILCPETTFEMGSVDAAGRISRGEPFIMLRPNVIYQCGEDGSRNNNCILQGGDFAVTSFYGVFDGIYETVENVQIRGLTFQSQKLFSAILEAAGDVTFKDCAFKHHGNMVPVLIQWRGNGPEPPAIDFSRNLRVSSASSASELFYQRIMRGPLSHDEIEAVRNNNNRRRLDQNEEEFKHKVTFQDSVFRDNFVVDTMGFPGIIENTFGSELNVINCLFQDNQYGKRFNPAEFGYAVRSFGPLTMESSCFIDNEFSTHSPVLVYGTSYVESGNHVSSAQTDLTCNFISLFTSMDEMTSDAATCIDAESDVCNFTQPPTSSPTAAPTSAPTDVHGHTHAHTSSARSFSIVLSSMLSLFLSQLI